MAVGQGASRKRRGGLLAVTCPGVLWLFLVISPPAMGQGVSEPQVELEDVVAVERLGRDIYAYDLLGTGTAQSRLEIGEDVAWMGAQGQIAVVVTDRRLLALQSGQGAWQEIRLRVHESPPENALIGKRVALVVTDKRLLGFDTGTGQWLSIDLGPNERLLDARVGAQTALVLTDRKAYGLSPERGGFVGISLAIQEKILSAGTTANAATVSTSWRYLVFRAPAGTWTESRRKLD